MTISEKSAYLKGLAEGMNLDTEKAEGKLIAGLIDLVTDLSLAVETLDDDYANMEEYMEEIDDDLADLEEYVYLEDEDDECLFDDAYEDCDGECDGCCGCDDLEDDDDSDVYVLDDEGMRCMMCDNCGVTVCYEETLDPATLVCPSCGQSCNQEKED